MKKIIILLLVLLVALSAAGCSSETSSQKSGGESKVEDTLLLNGKIIGYNAGGRVGVNGILLDKKLDIDGKEIKEVLFDEDIITDLIPRKYMTYYFEGGTSLKEEFGRKIDVQVKIDSNSLEYDPEYFASIAKIIEVVSLDDETNPRDKTKDEYPLD